MHLLKVLFILSIIGNCTAQVHLDHELRNTIESDPQKGSLSDSNFQACES